jgi:arylsulfatase A-like enzyme
VARTARAVVCGPGDNSSWRQQTDLIHSGVVPSSGIAGKSIAFVRSLASEWYLSAVLLLAPGALRTALLIEQSIRPGTIDLDGYLSDLTVSVCFAVLLVILLSRLRHKPRSVAAGVFAVLWTLIHVGNYEHIKILGAPLQFTYAGYMGDAVFVAGSAASISRALLSGVLIVLGVLGSVHVIRAERPRATPAARAIVVLASALLNAAWPLDVHALLWRQDHFIEAMLRRHGGDAEAEGRRSPLPPTFAANLHPDLEGTPRLSAAGRPNVLLIVLEGISGGNIPVIARAHGINNRASMPKLSAFAENNLYFSTFITNQRQTNRGEFALLCGQMERLVSTTSKMTEYARDGGEACLPNVLAEAGYKTAYLQPAPLSFMLKDQFMAKAGFVDVRGSNFYVKGYAKSSWGVDDRAFFESTAPVIEEFQTQTPWFVTLLTVGTHHPYTVPKDYVAGEGLDADPHARAIRYADDAVMAFIDGLEASGVLQDTLLLVTSDESFGVDDYDDQTKLLSYNWGFMVAKPPEGARGVIHEPYYQADTALSIVDYLGLTGPFVGRSFFRKYHRPRQLVFANTYQRKVYWASASATVECNEDLEDCERHTFGEHGMFGVDRVSSRASAHDVAPLRELIVAGKQRQGEQARGTTQLMQSNAVVQDVGPGSQGLVFGGQYFTLEADQEVAVILSASAVGRDFAALLDTDVYARGFKYEVLPPPLYDGDHVRIEYVYSPGKQERNIEIRLRARSFSDQPGRLVIDRAEMTVRPRSEGTLGGVTKAMQIERSNPMQSYLLGSGYGPESTPGLLVDPCIQRREAGQFLGKSCGKGNLLFGPRIRADRHSDVRVLFDVEADNGSAVLRAELVSNKGAVVHERTEVPPLKDGGRRMITLRHEMDQPVDDLEARLVLVEAEPTTILTISRAALELRPTAMR